MTVDISRKSFDPGRHTAWTTTMQGRVATDAPINENQAQRDRRVRALLTDLAGRCGYPEILPDSFKIGISGGQLTVAPGRYYVDGHLADNFGSGTQVFDPVLSELRGPNPVLFSAQPFGTGTLVGPAPAPAAGTHIAYVDIWQRDVTFLEDDTILDPGIATDSFARRQTVWQVRTFGPVGAGTTCSTNVPAWDAFTGPSHARLTTRANPAGTTNDPCLLPPGALYRGIDNRTYLVAIHGFTAAGVPLIKFSRTNGTVATTILAQPQADVLEVAQVAKDDFLRFNPGDWVEVTDEARLLAGLSGTMVRVLSVDDASNTITLEDPLPAGALRLVGVGPAADQAVHPVLRRWDQAGEIRDENGVVLVDLDAPGATGLIPVPTTGTFVALEDGVEAALTLAAGPGTARVNDNWSFIARYADTSVEVLSAAPPQDYQHHFCRLAMVTAAGGVFTAVVEDCRDPLGGDCDCCCITVEVGDSIQDAINKLPVDTGGCICLAAGVHQISNALLLTISNVQIVGESRGAIVELLGDGTVLQIAGVNNVDIDMVGFRHRDGGAAGAMVEIVRCASVNLWRCGIAALVGSTSIGVGVQSSDDIAIRDCDFGALAFGVVTLGEGGLLTIADNVFALEGEELVGHTAISAAKTTGILRVTGNTIGGVLNGVIVNDDPAADTRHSLAVGSLIADNDIRLRFSEKLPPDQIMRGIDSAADSCTIRGNRVNLAGRIALGIFVSGADLTVIENRVEVDGDQQGRFTSGIVIGATDDKAAHLTTGVSVTHNAVRGTMIGVFAGYASDLTIADNRLHDGVETSVMAMLLTQLTNATVRGNTIGRTRISVLAGGGSQLRLIGNHLAPAGAGIALLGEFAPTVDGNSIERARSFGIMLVQTIGRTAVTGNRLRNCGYDGNLAGGIGALFVLGELAVCGNEIMDTGLGSDGKPNIANVAAILGVMVLEALVSENLVSTTLPAARPDGLEDRALAMLGIWDISQGDNEPTIGFPCTITGNKFHGKGFSALVQLLAFPLNDRAFLRFERVLFSNNYCAHFGERSAGTASVILTGRAGVVMGNQVKGEGRALPSIDMTGMKGTEVGNVTTGNIVNDPNFPAPEANFNLRF